MWFWFDGLMGGARIYGGGNVLLGGMEAAIVIVVADVGYCGCCVCFFSWFFWFVVGVVVFSVVVSGFLRVFLFWLVPRSRGRKRGKGREREREIVKKKYLKKLKKIEFEMLSVL